MIIVLVGDIIMFLDYSVERESGIYRNSIDDVQCF
jgi:hypothetical protein